MTKTAAANIAMPTMIDVYRHIEQLHSHAAEIGARLIVQLMDDDGEAYLFEFARLETQREITLLYSRGGQLFESTVSRCCWDGLENRALHFDARRTSGSVTMRAA